ncbi:MULTISPECIES: N-acetylglucosamine-6-phosphate deacetylase [Marinomonas]|uniref:N-acetylglucosamine 6-phosphate deacetylase n=2 Tax=Marinomonas TaxID=28253 RepID=A0A366CYP9_9GAMM|nr:MULTISPECIES: N-acetylglucosamine-6-phosphate deacetylase [Marinomonas]AEF54153.1 N-acetylglucosamine-6-phosphate deacetylase [Marinomonas posidonica IVIA-Po-181]RBO82364.1 N-acetylglucosamine 6-phosphate deacetylase [Marinomonas aquiplantarum]
MTVLKVKRLFDGEQWLNHQQVTIENGKIQDITPIDYPQLATQLIDILAPGFIDVHVNGGGDVLFNHTPTLDALKVIVKNHAQFGTVAMMPTLISDDYDVMSQAHDAVCEALQQGLAGIIGLHYEGPYLNPIRKGVHNEDKLRMPNEEKLFKILDVANHGKLMVTLAPEQVPDGFIEKLVKQHAIVCIGHSAATYDEAIRAVHCGARGFTHLFNAMTPLTSREPGVVGAALQNQYKTWCGLIADGHHVHPATMNIAMQAKGCEHIMLVTDAIQSVGSSKSELPFLGQKIHRKNGKVTTADGTLAGSDLDMASAVRNTIQLIKRTPQEAFQMASLRPAQFLGLDHQLGRIKVGYQASLVALNQDYYVTQTWIDGHPMLEPKTH